MRQFLVGTDTKVRMFSEIPYFWRVVILITLMFAAAGYDYYRNRAGSSRWREYGLVLIGGVVGAFMGMVNDIITSSISPEYFTFGKGLAGGNGLQVRAAMLGIKAGFSAGVIVAGILLYAATRKHRQSSGAYRRIFRCIYKPILGAVIMGVALPAFLSSVDPAGFAAKLEGVADANQIRWFITVWWIHLGLYAGATCGLIWAIVELSLRNKKAIGV